MNIIWSEKIKLIQILLGLKNHLNTNMNVKTPFIRCLQYTNKGTDETEIIDEVIFIGFTLHHTHFVVQRNSL